MGGADQRGSSLRLALEDGLPPVYLKLGAALRCWARLDAYQREGQRPLLGEDLTLSGGLEELPGFLPALDRVRGRVPVVAPDDPAPGTRGGSFTWAEALSMPQDIGELLIDVDPSEAGLHGGSGVGGSAWPWVRGKDLSLGDDPGGDGL